jgi:hypothetical protein
LKYEKPRAASRGFFRGLPAARTLAVYGKHPKVLDAEFLCLFSCPPVGGIGLELARVKNFGFA